MFSLRSADLRKLNSLTKYPSIPTHHALDPKNGGLLEEPARYEGPVIGTEKVDGTNGRIILLPDGTWLIGSREDLLTASGDVVHNPALGIVDALRDLAHSLREHGSDEVIRVFYLEVYGSKQLPAWKQYGAGDAAVRLFDIADIPLDHYDWDLPRIASWRQREGQRFAGEEALNLAVKTYGMDLTPRLFQIDASALPPTIERMREFMEPYRHTQVATFGEPGLNEGIVLRTPGRETITKARFQDYERTLKRRQKAG
ncbi:RNA ligase family protein [Nonomuraea sp. SBT364]|uniref:RNA ligase family protein n=1 Tax=Nonomuraea sp. SBT364 TaxID=1580530 RepID=UPI00066D3BC0|nr:RNA ligase family protein [Nonomuraea sp. SBT364]